MRYPGCHDLLGPGRLVLFGFIRGRFVGGGGFSQSSRHTYFSLGSELLFPVAGGPPYGFCSVSKLVAQLASHHRDVSGVTVSGVAHIDLFTV